MREELSEYERPFQKLPLERISIVSIRLYGDSSEMVIGRPLSRCSLRACRVIRVISHSFDEERFMFSRSSGRLLIACDEIEHRRRVRGVARLRQRSTHRVLLIFADVGKWLYACQGVKLGFPWALSPPIASS